MTTDGLPEGFSFSRFNPHPTKEDYDQFDIVHDGKIVHTMDVYMGGCMGSQHEYALQQGAESKARIWVQGYVAHKAA